MGKDGVLMNPIISNELNLFAQELQYFLSPVVLQDIAKQVGFVQRSSKYQANELIAFCVWLSQEIASTSLTQLCSQLEASTGVLMSSEGLNQRFNSAAVVFLRKVFTSLLTQKLCSNHSISAHVISTFNRIRILDATSFQLPDHFANDKKTGWIRLIGLVWLATIALLWTNLAKLIPNQVVSLSIFIVMIVIVLGASLTGLYRFKKKKY